jgi:hypothetical protein
MANGELATQEQISPATLEAVIVNGDLSRLSPGQKVQWYKARCEAAGLDPRTQPFQYLQLQGKLTLYATKAATDQLIASRKLTVEIVERRHDESLGTYEVQCRVTFPDGRKVDDLAALTISGLRGDSLCNAVMKCVTKAKRRTVLSACGLGMLDETEVETIPGAVPDAHHAKYHDNATGHGSGAYASPEMVKAFSAWLAAFVEDINTKWLDGITDQQGNISGPGEIASTWQLSGHLLKWAKAEGLVNAPDDVRAGQRDKFTAVAWVKDQQAVIDEARNYCRTIWREAKVKLTQSALPAPASDDDSAEDAILDAMTAREPGEEG